MSRREGPAPAGENPKILRAGCFRESDCLSKRETEPEDDLTKDKREVRRRGKAYVASSSWTRASEEVKRPKRTSA